eukprot:XP_011448613.1 PREDICTED: uncharacterized protein LOC105343110 [Crassostrea gigas]
MNRPCSAPDVVQCSMCQTSVAPMYCEVCITHLCKECEEPHLSDSSKVHKVVSFKQHWRSLNYPNCRKHPTKQCDLLCEQCGIHICIKCISSGKHLGHKLVDIYQVFESKKQLLRKDLQEIENSLYPTHKQIASNIPVQKTDLKKNSQKLTTTINKQGEIWHREIDTIVRNLKFDVGEIEFKHLVILSKLEDEIRRIISKITQAIDKLKKLLNSKDVCLVSEYKSTNAEFRKLPPKLKVSLPNFRPQEIHKDQLIELFGYLSASSLTTEEQDYSMTNKGVESPSQDRSLMDVPQVITAIDTGYEYIYGVACLNDTEVWTRGNSNIMKLYNLRGELVKSIQTKSGNMPEDIKVTENGDLVYTDFGYRTVNVVKNSQIQTVITLQKWGPLSVCSTSSGDLLIVMDSDDHKQTKVVRYSDSTETQTIQFSDEEQPLYSSDGFKYISENRNLDICVSDNSARAVVVVNQVGKLRFSYTGLCYTTEEPFDPRGITTDSESRILIADYYNHCIHILDQDCQFLRYIKNCNTELPWGLSVDTRGNLSVSVCCKGEVKKIQYYL